MTNVLFNVVDLVEFSVSHGLVTLSKVRTSLYILFHGILISLHKLKLLLKFPVYHQPTHPPTHPPGSRLWCCPRVVFQLYHLTLLCLLKTWVARPMLYFHTLWCHTRFLCFSGRLFILLCVSRSGRGVHAVCCLRSSRNCLGWMLIGVCHSLFPHASTLCC